MMHWWLAAPLSVVVFVLPVWAADGPIDEKACLEVREVVK